MTYIPDEPVVVLTASDARMLWQAANLNALRLKHRTGDTALYDLLVKVYRVGLLEIRPAGSGNGTRQSTASEERETWTVKQLSDATGRAMRTIRLDIAQGALPASKAGNAWLIRSTAAATYIATRRRN